MRVTSLGFSTDLMVRRLAGSIIEDHGDHLIVRTPHIPNFWWGNFVLLGRPLRAGDTQWIRQTCRESFPGAQHLALGIDGMRGEVGAATEVAAMTLEVTASVVLMANAFSLSNDAATPGVRRLSTDADWTQLATLRDAWQGPAADGSEATFRAKRLTEARELNEYGGAWFGSFEGDLLAAALGIVGDGSGIARYQAVETHPDHRRRGHARRLLQAAAGHARNHLATKQLIIVADPTSHAIELYRSLGFTELERQVQLQGRTAPM
ncbi:MAG TPA: GNAT family N-acetyltransferase [Mycobacteriales bacterium]|nr:GNAT family N-acetyltransferase [Mycobacteriales bacterium]